MIETTADVVSGDSGGPLFDAEGEVVGIDTAASTGSEIDGYAIPIAAGARHRRADPLGCGDQHGPDRAGRLPRGRAEQRGVGYAYGFGYGRDASAASGAAVGNVISGDRCRRCRATGR